MAKWMGIKQDRVGLMLGSISHALTDEPAITWAVRTMPRALDPTKEHGYGRRLSRF